MMCVDVYSLVLSRNTVIFPFWARVLMVGAKVAGAANRISFMPFSLAFRLRKPPVKNVLKPQQSALYCDSIKRPLHETCGKYVYAGKPPHGIVFADKSTV
jgi:hypothetical protein